MVRPEVLLPIKLGSGPLKDGCRLRKRALWSSKDPKESQGEA